MTPWGDGFLTGLGIGAAITLGCVWLLAWVDLRRERQRSDAERGLWTDIDRVGEFLDHTFGGEGIAVEVRRENTPDGPLTTVRRVERRDDAPQP